MNINSLKVADKKDFDRIFEIMEDAFPISERRTFEKQLSLFDNSCYKPYVYYKNNNIEAFILCWEIDEIIFIEHFAVDKKLRGTGIGTKILKDFVSSSHSPVCLEVELPENEISKRRINFYERLGFKLNDFEYFQPALQPGQEKIQLKIMSYPEKLSEEDFNLYRKLIYKSAYTKHWWRRFLYE